MQTAYWKLEKRTFEHLPKIGLLWVMSLKPLEVWVQITELPTLVEKKLKKTIHPNQCHYPLMTYITFGTNGFIENQERYVKFA